MKTTLRFPSIPSVLFGRAAASLALALALGFAVPRAQPACAASVSMFQQGKAVAAGKPVYHLDTLLVLEGDKPLALEVHVANRGSETVTASVTLKGAEATSSRASKASVKKGETGVLTLTVKGKSGGACRAGEQKVRVAIEQNGVSCGIVEKDLFCPAARR